MRLAFTSTKLPMCTSSASPDAGERPDPRVGADARLLHDAEGADLGGFGYLHIPQDAARAQLHSITQDDAAFEDAVHVDEHVAAAFEIAAHVDARRIGERHAVLEELAGLVHLVLAFERGQLRLAVHSEAL